MTIKIALDAMGGDHGPETIITGAVQAARDFDLTIQLVGQPEQIEAALSKQQDIAGLNLPIVPASETIEMDDSPSKAVKQKKDSSMMVATRLVKAGESDAFVTAGNSGAGMATALLGLGRIKGIKRPALGSIFPALTERGFIFMLDMGANTDVKAEYLLQFAQMGHHYAEQVLNIPNPTIGLLSTGEEEEKGSLLIKEATPLLRESGLNFKGNVEGKDVSKGVFDVVVTDGFTGNVFLKTSEGVASMILKVLETEIKARPLAMLGALLARPAFKAIKTRMDYREFGGAPLLGVKGITVIAHGRSDAYAIRNALRVAKQSVEVNLVQVLGG